MSIFKVKHWWTNEQGGTSTTHEGLQNGSCLKVDRLNTHVDSDCVLVADDSVLKIYKPSLDTTQALLEAKLGDSILQVETGKFIADTENRQILILHPQSYMVYELNRKEGHTDAGEQNSLTQVLKHTFTRKAYSVTCGPFANVKSRDLICVQGLDGSLSFFDQNTFLFLCVFNDVIIPGPVCYVASSDSFVVYKSTWILEIYTYQQLRESSELTSRQNKASIPQWTYNAGEEVSAVQVIKTSSNISSIIALSERHICCFQDNGLMKFMLKFDYMPICFFAYIIGWYYEPGARLLIMVASDDSKLYIYEGTSLLWSCELLHPVVSISRCFLKSLPGGLVTLSTTGNVDVCYFGTVPNLNPSNVPVIRDKFDAEQIQTELEAAEELLAKIIDNNEDSTNGIEEIVKIKADIGEPTSKPIDFSSVNPTITCPVVVVITCEDPKLIQSIQITYDCRAPFSSSDSAISLDNINGTEIVETHLHLSSSAKISDTSITIIVTLTDSDAKIRIKTITLLMPLSSYFTPGANKKGSSNICLRVETNQRILKFEEIFTDFSREELTTNSNGNEITFLHRISNVAVKVKASDTDYVFEADDYSDLTAIMQHFILKLSDHYHRMKISNFKLKFKYDEELVKQLLHTFLKCIEAHAKDRSELKRYEDQLNVLQRQFTTVQRKLLVQYGALPPGDCDPLEFLMKDTHERIINVVHDILRCRDNTIRSGCSLSAVGNLIIYILKQSSTDVNKVKLIEEVLSFSSLYEIHQEWQEYVIQSLPYIMNVFNKSEKEKEKLAPVSEQGMLSHINMKRFLKQIRLIFDKMFSEILYINAESKIGEKVTRIEELVEVI